MLDTHTLEASTAAVTATRECWSPAVSGLDTHSLRPTRRRLPDPPLAGYRPAVAAMRRKRGS